MGNPRRLTESEHVAGSDEEALARLIAAAPERARLEPGAHARIAARLVELDGRAAHAWWGLRVGGPLLVTAGVLLFVWVRERPRPIQPLIATHAPSGADEGSHPAGPLPPIGGAHLDLLTPGRATRTATGLRLAEGTLAVGTGAAALDVETVVARVEVRAHSSVQIRMHERQIRVAAQKGSAKVAYAEGRTELVEPPASAAPVPTKPPAEPRAPAVVAPAPEAPHAPAHPPVDPESAHLALALGKLRSAPPEALRLLDEHLVRYPQGTLRPEAERARVAVLLKLGRQAEALATLDRMDMPLDELRVVRGELRTELGRWREAIVDFNVALLADDRFEERALLGRAICHKRLGEDASAREDLERYLARHPQGTFVERARVELSNLR